MTSMQSVEVAGAPNTPASSESTSATAPGAEIIRSETSDAIDGKPAPGPEADSLTSIQQAANDDRAFDARQRIQYLKPGRRAFRTAMAASALWIALLVSDALVSGRFQALRDLLKPEGAFFLLMIVAPVALFFIFAKMLRQTIETQIHTESLASAIKSLSQPDERLPDQVASLGLNIRREIAGISTGVERAIGRAAELEAQVRAEILHLEKTYREGEHRVTGVLTQLRNERAALSGHADTAVEAIYKVREALSEHVEYECARLFDGVENAESRFDHLFFNHSTALANMLEAQRDQLKLEIDGKVHDMLSHMASSLDAMGHQMLETMKAEAEADRGASSQFWEPLRVQIEELGKRQHLGLEQATATATKQYADCVAEACRLLTEVGKSVSGDLRSDHTALIEKLQAANSNVALQASEAISRDVSSAIDDRLKGLRGAVDEDSRATLEKIGRIEEELGAFKIVLEQARTSDNETLAALAQTIGSKLTESLQAFDTSARSAHETLDAIAQKHLEAVRTEVSEKIATQQETVERFLISSNSALNAMMLERLGYLHNLLFNEETGFAVHIRHEQTAAARQIEGLSSLVGASVQEGVVELKEQLERIISSLASIREDNEASKTAMNVLHHSVAHSAQASDARHLTLRDDLKAFTSMAGALSSAIQDLKQPSPARPAITQGAARLPALPRDIERGYTPGQHRRPGWLSDLLARSEKEP
ncbi:MAG: hypothetical protein K2Y29_13720 [Beijerinckiaceae bacterium]|nr:hypothetical protein [Beijerinckiaceae bacterium]